jgi:hypothetical protein
LRKGVGQRIADGKQCKLEPIDEKGQPNEYQQCAFNKSKQLTRRLLQYNDLEKQDNRNYRGQVSDAAERHTPEKSHDVLSRSLQRSDTTIDAMVA